MNPNPDHYPNRKRVTLVLIISAVVYGGFLLALGYAWYAKQWVSSFHFFNDAAEWKQMDKFAHLFWTFQVSALAARLLFWARASDRQSALLGTLMGFSFVSLIEIPDGFSEAYGASVFDILANATGAAVFLGQRLWMHKIICWPKFSFHQTAFAPLRPAMLGNGWLEEILKDYNGQTFWYSMKLPWIPLPSWLVIAVGIGAEGMVHGRDQQNALANFTSYRKFFLSVDLNLSSVKTSSPALSGLLHIFNIIKFPAPAFEFSTRGIKFHPIYF